MELLLRFGAMGFRLPRSVDREFDLRGSNPEGQERKLPSEKNTGIIETYPEPRLPSDLSKIDALIAGNCTGQDMAARKGSGLRA
jgi:hypothetical protein